MIYIHNITYNILTFTCSDSDNATAVEKESEALENDLGENYHVVNDLVENYPVEDVDYVEDNRQEDGPEALDR